MYVLSNCLAPAIVLWLFSHLWRSMTLPRSAQRHKCTIWCLALSGFIVVDSLAAGLLAIQKAQVVTACIFFVVAVTFTVLALSYFDDQLGSQLNKFKHWFKNLRTKLSSVGSRTLLTPT